MKRDVVRCAVVGLGQGMHDVNVIAHHDRLALVAVCDTDVERYEWLTGRRPIEESSSDLAQQAGFPGAVPGAAARALAAVLAVLLLLFVVSVPRHGHYADPVQYPDGAPAYMKANGLHGYLFHDRTWGGHLMWHEPRQKVVIGGRRDPYTATGVFSDYLNAKFGANPQPVLDKYHVQWVLMPAGCEMVKNLERDPRWVLRYSDKVSVLLERAAPKAKG